MTCAHETVHCLNEYELIRKYCCETCGLVMMCACDQEIGESFLSHQLKDGCVLETQERVPVTLGFVKDICRECRGLRPQAHPMAAIPGRTSKIKRYYWREIQFEEFKRFAAEATAAGIDPQVSYSLEATALLKKIQRDVLSDIKKLHATSPKYVYEEISQAETLSRYNIEQIDLMATFAPKTEDAGAGIIEDGKVIRAEEFAANHYQRLGWKTMFVESVPFHVLFGVYMWLLIQDAKDPKSQMVFFGSRRDFESNREGTQIHTFLPEDFGTLGYAERRANAIDEHLSDIASGDLEWFFDYWLDHSSDFREYLWAHREADVQRARALIDVLPIDVIVRILRYLVGDYWGRYTGWPDLLVYKGDTFFFAEVKASKDRLSEEQKRWIADNATNLNLPFKLIKIHREATRSL
jgi:hypothetical protein